MATIDEDLGSIERDIRTLKIEYEQYFGGGRSRPPTDTQWRLEVTLKKYSDRAAEFSSGQRFRYSNLTQTYAKYHDMWRKKLAQKETGASPHHFGAAAKAIEAERARQAAAAKPPEQAETAAVTAAEHAMAVAHASAEAATRAAEGRQAHSTFAARVAAARRFLPQFGIAGYCGFGRMPSSDMPRVLAEHLEAIATIA